MAVSGAMQALLRADQAIGLDFTLRVERATSTQDSLAHTPARTEQLHREPITSPHRLGAEAMSPSPVSPVVSQLVSHLVMDGESNADALERLRADHAVRCPHCTRVTFHRNLVFGEGNPNAELVFVGEAPGETEDELGRPFVGRAGQKLDEMIVAMGLRRDDVYIANILKSRPPGNRTPLPDEVALCGPWLERQLALIRPSVIVSLGSPATRFMLQAETGITRLRGIWANWSVPAILGGGTIRVMPTFHPAYLLRNYTPQTRSEVWSDLQQVVAQLAIARKNPTS